jgi:hypothetical protein
MLGARFEARSGGVASGGLDGAFWGRSGVWGRLVHASVQCGPSAATPVIPHGGHFIGPIKAVYPSSGRAARLS